MMIVFVLQGEQILKLAEMCRKLETEEEKVLPFYSSSLSQKEEEQAEAVEAEPPTEPLARVRNLDFVEYYVLFSAGPLSESPL